MLSFQKALLNEQIFLIRGTTKVANPPESNSDISYSGSPDSPLFLLYQPEKKELPKPVQEMLAKLLKAIPGLKNEVLTINLSTVTEDALDSFLKAHKPPMIVCHHPRFSAFRPGFSWPDGSRILPAPSLEQLFRDQQAKRSYWAELQNFLAV